ncbi:MAG TPA: ComEA family DNA-binding protein [Pyrinomonadaceae bacterium]|nr:ComEA family DNA-binding protein [Pyrinomonadaceae bacterium]
MRTSNLPKNFVVLFSVFLFGSPLISGCTSRTFTPAIRKEKRSRSGSFVVNINTATIADLEKLPHVGPVLAAKIVEHRERYGPFRQVEHLLLVDGISEERFRKLIEFINTE